MEINKVDFDIVTLEDEIRVDALWKELLMKYYESLLREGVDADRATQLANGADHFIRDFVVAVKQQNLLTEPSSLVRQFAGNWYIVSTAEPTIEYLAEMLPGVAGFCRFLEQQGLLSPEYCCHIERECVDLPYYETRIESFWDISGNGYSAWGRECSLRPVHD
jgi:hypothetical protein